MGKLWGKTKTKNQNKQTKNKNNLWAVLKAVTINKKWTFYSKSLGINIFSTIIQILCIKQIAQRQIFSILYAISHQYLVTILGSHLKKDSHSNLCSWKIYIHTQLRIFYILYALLYVMYIIRTQVIICIVSWHSIYLPILNNCKCK